MIFNATIWNRWRYSLYAPIYDPVVRMLNRGRRMAIDMAVLKPGERVLIVGAGTGLDLEFLPPGLETTAIDLTPNMLAQLQRRAARMNMNAQVSVMNAEALEFPDASFDCVMLHLILAVVPDPEACIREAARVLKPDGRISVFDKFLADDARASLPRRALNVLTHFVATDINRRLGPLLRSADLELESMRPAGFGGLFRAARARRRS